MCACVRVCGFKTKYKKAFAEVYDIIDYHFFLGIGTEIENKSACFDT